MSKIAVLGGGLSGRLIAFQLAEQGVAVELFEKGERNGAQAAAYVAAAMLAPSSEAVEATPEVIRLGRQSFALWRGILGRLNTPVMMQEKGSLIVWHTQDKPLSAEFARHLKRGGVPEHETIRWNADEIAANEPQLAGRFSDGLYLPAEGQLDGRQVLNALADALESMNIACHWSCEREVEDLAAQYDWVIDCRGYGAKAAWNRPSESQLRGIRGEVARVYAPEVELSRPVRLLHPRYPLYIAPKENHIFVIGATQIESESQAPASVRSGLDVLVGVHVLLAVVDDGQVFDFRTCTACKTFQSLSRRTVFHGIGHGRAFFHDFLVGLNGLHVFDLNGQAARRSVGGVFGCAVKQLRFFQAFGNGSGKMVAQIIEGLWREFFSEKFD